MFSFDSFITYLKFRFVLDSNLFIRIFFLSLNLVSNELKILT